MELVEELVEVDQGKKLDEITMAVFGEIANSVDDVLEVEVDFPSNHEDNFMPILDMKMQMAANNKVVYQFYKKPMTNKHTMMANSVGGLLGSF